MYNLKKESTKNKKKLCYEVSVLKPLSEETCFGKFWLGAIRRNVSPFVYINLVQTTPGPYKGVAKNGK